jgi:hypothetical protein
MLFTKNFGGLKETIPILMEDGFVYHNNGILPLEKAIASTMEELNFIREEKSPSLSPPVDTINDIDNTWMLNLYLDPRWEKKIANYKRWQLDRFCLREKKTVKVEILFFVPQESAYSFAWRIFDETLPDDFKYFSYMDCLDVDCFSELFNPFINGFRSWWKENQDVLCQ